MHIISVGGDGSLLTSSSAGKLTPFSCTRSVLLLSGATGRAAVATLQVASPSSRFIQVHTDDHKQ